MAKMERPESGPSGLIYAELHSLCPPTQRLYRPSTVGRPQTSSALILNFRIIPDPTRNALLVALHLCLLHLPLPLRPDRQL